MPLSTSPLGKWVLYTATEVFDGSTGTNVKIESAADGSASVDPANYFVMTTPGTLLSVVVSFLDGIDGPSSTNAHYSFTFRTANPIPTSGKLVITVPSATDGIVWADSSLTLVSCTSNCDASSASM